MIKSWTPSLAKVQSLLTRKPGACSGEGWRDEGRRRALESTPAWPFMSELMRATCLTSVLSVAGPPGLGGTKEKR